MVDDDAFFPTPPPPKPPKPKGGIPGASLARAERAKAASLIRALDAMDVFLAEGLNYTTLGKRIGVSQATARRYVSLVHDHWATKAAELLHPAKMEQLRRMVLYRKRLIDEFEASKGRKVVTQVKRPNPKPGEAPLVEYTETTSEGGDPRLLELVLVCDRNLVALLGPMRGPGEEVPGIPLGGAARMEILINRKEYLPPIPVPESHIKVLPPALAKILPGTNGKQH